MSEDKPPEQDKEKPTEQEKDRVKAMVARMAEAYGIQRKELPGKLECSKTVVNNWGYYARPPYSQLVKCSLLTGVSMDWLLTGEGTKQLMTGQSLDMLKALCMRVMTDGLEYKMITENYNGAIEQMMEKLGNDIDKWANLLLPPSEESDSKKGSD